MSVTFEPVALLFLAPDIISLFAEMHYSPKTTLPMQRMLGSIFCFGSRIVRLLSIVWTGILVQ